MPLHDYSLPRRFQHILDFSQQVGVIGDWPVNADDDQLIFGPQAFVCAKIFAYDSLEPVPSDCTASLAGDRDPEFGPRLRFSASRFRFGDNHFAPSAFAAVGISAEQHPQEGRPSAQPELPSETIIVGIRFRHGTASVAGCELKTIVFNP
jgi:hypothetical protein